MKLNEIMLTEGDPVGEIRKDLDRRMKEVFKPHKDLKQLERALKSAITLGSTTKGAVNNALAIAEANKKILDVLWDEMQFEKGNNGTVEEAFEGALSSLEKLKPGFQQAQGPTDLKKRTPIVMKEISDAAKLILSKKLNGTNS